MARSDIFSFLVFFLIASGVAMLSIVQADYEDASAAPAPEPIEEMDSYLVRCAAKLTEKCGDNIFSNIFTTQSEVSFECCQKLMFMGRKCHDAMVNFITTLPAFSKNASITLPRSKQVWNKCALLAEEASLPV